MDAGPKSKVFSTRPAPRKTAIFAVRRALTRRKVSAKNHASLVSVVYSHSAGGPCRRRGGEPQAFASGGVYPPTWGRSLFAPVPWKPRSEQDHCYRPGRDGHDRAGVPSACAQSARGVGGERPLVG